MTQDATTPSGAAAIIEAARQAAQPHPLADTELFVVATNVDGHPGYDVVDVRDYTGAPPRTKTGAPLAHDVSSLLGYTLRHAEDGTTVWVDQPRRRITSVIDDHAGDVAGSPGRASHTITLQLQTTPEWNAWAKADGQQLSQVDFAELIEDQLPTIHEPDGATMLELAQSFHANTAVAFRSSTRLANGEVQLHYDEETTAAAGRTGQLTVPSTLTLILPPFVGEDAILLTARFRYRLSSGRVTMGVKLDRPEDAIRRSLENITERLIETLGDIPVYAGAPR